MNNSHSILIIGARAPIALELCRSFSKSGHKVVCADSLNFPAVKFSKYCNKYIKIPAPALHPNEFKITLSEIIENEKISDIIPTSEESFYLSMIKDDLKCKVWVSDFSLMDKLHNKLSFIDFAKSIFNVPETINLHNFNDYSNSKSYVFKPIYTRFGRHIFIDKSYNQIDKFIKKPNNWIAQQKLDGELICSYSIYDKGELKTNILYKPSYFYKGGAGMHFEQISNEELKSIIKQFGNDINYTGQISFDFIISNNTPFLIECNPRGTSGAHLIGEQLADCFFSKDEIIIENQKNRALKLPILIEKPWALFEKDFRSAKDVVFDWQDILPFFGQVFSVFEFLYKKTQTGLPLSDVMTYDIEYNGEKDC